MTDRQLTVDGREVDHDVVVRERAQFKDNHDQLLDAVRACINAPGLDEWEEAWDALVALAIPKPRA